MKVPNAKGGDAPRPAGKAAPSRCQRKCRKSYSNTLTHTHTYIYIHTYTHFYEPQLSERSELPAAWPPCPTSPLPQRGVGGVGGRGKQFAAAVFLFILFSVILLCDPSVDFMYLFMGKLGKWLSLHFPSLSRSRALSRPLRQGAKGYNYEVYTPFAQPGLPQRLHHFQLVRISFSDFQLAFLPRPISRSPLGFSASHGL